MRIQTRSERAKATAQEDAELQLVFRLSEYDTVNPASTNTQIWPEEASTIEAVPERSLRSKDDPKTISNTQKSKRRIKLSVSLSQDRRRTSLRGSRKVSYVKTDVETEKTQEVRFVASEDASYAVNVFPTPSQNTGVSRGRARTKKEQPASAALSKARVSGRVRKPVLLAKPVKERTSLKIILKSVRYEKVEYEVLKKWGMRRAKVAKDYWPYPHYPGFKLGHNPWAHLNWPAPNIEHIREVHKLLVDHHKKFDFGSFVSMPAHATEAKVTIDAIFQTLFAQSTDNEIAIDTHSRLCNAFPYTVDGKKYVGKMPNWHDIRLLERDELPAALQQGGFHEMRAGFVKGILDCVYEKNLERKAEGRQQYEHEGNPPDAKDFVPGLLSMDWLTDNDDNSDEAVLGRLIQLSGIGIKSAMCVMAFSMKRPLFVVDVHVLRYAQWLGWVPKDANNVDWVAMYLHKYIPDDIKYDLHNQIWTHCANENSRESNNRTVICPFCGARPPARTRDVSQHVCPLAEFLPPLEKRWGTAYKLQLRHEQKEAAKTKAAERESGQDEVSDDPVTKTPALEQIKIKTFVTGLPTPPSSPIDAPTEIVDAVESDSSQAIKTDDSPVQTKKKPKKLNLKAKSHRFEDITREQADELQAAGYFLWEFRPMDNTFMEEWGTFEKKPRYKWERDTIMDRDVAITWEYANSVLNHDHSHKWSRHSPQEEVTKEIMTAMEE